MIKTKKLLIASMILVVLFIGGCIQGGSKDAGGSIVTVVNESDPGAEIKVTIPELEYLKQQADATTFLARMTLLMAVATFVGITFNHIDNSKLQKDVKRISKTLEKSQRNKGKK